jgi:hypothetical protein
MPITRDELKAKEKDYFFARWENDELSMEPYCQCGSILDEQYFCEQCKRQCQCTFIVCDGHETLAVVRKFLHGNPKFKNFETAVIDE